MAPKQNIVAEELGIQLEHLEDFFRLDARETTLFFTDETTRRTLHIRDIAETAATLAPREMESTVWYNVHLHRHAGNKLDGRLKVDTGKGNVCLTYIPKDFPDVQDVFRMSMVAGRIASRDSRQWPDTKKTEGLYAMTRLMSNRPTKSQE
jgi:hypothetical protein